MGPKKAENKAMTMISSGRGHLDDYTIKLSPIDAYFVNGW
jgi:hypothetical protein